MSLRRRFAVRLQRREAVASLRVESSQRPAAREKEAASAMESAMSRLLKKFEGWLVRTLALMLSVVVLLATVELAWLLVTDIVSPPILLLEIDELLELFGFFLLILIGLELIETIRSYEREHIVHLEVVLLVAMVAISRKVVIMDLKQTPSVSLLGLGLLILALAVAYFIVKRISCAGCPHAARKDSRE